VRLAEIRGLRGADVEAELQAFADRVAEMTEVQAQATVSEVRALVALGRGELRVALDLARASYELYRSPDATSLQTAMRAAAWLGDAGALRDARRVLAEQPGRVAATVRLEADAALAALEGRRAEAIAGFVEATRRWRERGLEFEAAISALSLVITLGPAGPEAQAAASEAGATFERLGASPFQERLAVAVRAAAPAPAPRVDVRPERRTPAVRTD
jgi:hypothetical protein